MGNEMYNDEQLAHAKAATNPYAALRAENARLREALFFYSNSEIYEETSMVHGRIPACGPPIIIEDGGERARAALAPAAAGKEG